METTYDWKFNLMECYINSDGESNVVYRVHYALTGRRGSIETSIGGIQDIQFITDDAFISFEDLTADVVQAWVEANMGTDLDRFKEILNNRLDDTINPPISNEIFITPPWNN